MVQIAVTRKVTSPDEHELSRMADNLWGTRKGEIVDRSTFEAAFEDYFLNGIGSMKNEATVKDRVWRIMRNKYGGGGRLVNEKVFEKSGGKDLRRDKLHRAKHVTTSREEYERLGASRADLEGYDTPPQYRYVGKQRSVTRFARAINTKAGLRYIDKRGRYVSVKKK